MSTDERPESLAAQAASWVPPWERPQPPDRAYQAAAVAAAVESEADASSDGDGEPDGVPPELPPLPGEADEASAVDSPVDVPDEDTSDPTDVGAVPEVPLPTPIEDAGENALEDERGPSVDAPVPDGDDAGDVFDAAADDDLGDDGELDMPLAEEPPAGAGAQVDEPETGQDTARAAFAAGAADAEAALANLPDTQFRSTVPAQGRGSQVPPVAVGEEDARSENESDLPALDDHELRAALEAILLVVDEPVAEMRDRVTGCL